MTKSDSINELAAALAKAQAEIENPPFDSKNPFFGSKYASLACVRDTVTPPLAKNGIAVLQTLSFKDGMVNCRTMLAHSSGQWIESDEFSAPAVPSSTKDGKVLPLSAQNVCAASTYLRRYCLQALVCVVGEPDDDGEESARPTPQAAAVARAKLPPKALRTPAEQLQDALMALDGAKDLQTLMRVYQEVTIAKPAAHVEACKAKASERKVAIQAGLDGPLPSEM